VWIKIILYNPNIVCVAIFRSHLCPGRAGRPFCTKCTFSIVIMGEEAELHAKVVALINRQLGESLAGAPLITAFRDELEAKRRCVETRYEPPKNCFASAGEEGGCKH
jgi:hypothetical protein